jgi:hypothetical protein
MFVADIFFVFILWSVLRVMQLARSARWKRVKAQVLGATVITSVSFGCPSVKINYRLSFGDHLLKGEEQFPFASIGDAERFALRFPTNESVIVRVNPNAEAEMRLFRSDQS